MKADLYLLIGCVMIVWWTLYFLTTKLHLYCPVITTSRPQGDLNLTPGKVGVGAVGGKVKVGGGTGVVGEGIWVVGRGSI